MCWDWLHACVDRLTCSLACPTFGIFAFCAIVVNLEIFLLCRILLRSSASCFVHNKCITQYCILGTPSVHFTLNRCVSSVCVVPWFFKSNDFGYWDLNISNRRNIIIAKYWCIFESVTVNLNLNRCVLSKCAGRCNPLSSLYLLSQMILGIEIWTTAADII